MVVCFEKCEINIDEFHKVEISSLDFVEHELEVVKLINWWNSKQKSYFFSTSGSTGQPKTVEISRDKIEYSIEATLSYVDPQNTFRSSLLAINPKMIGGAMVVFRALARGLDLTVVKPSAKPMQLVDPSRSFDLISLVPIQLKNLRKSDYERLSCIIVGGAASEPSYTSSGKVYFSFGMTETVSHFALRQSDSVFYKCIGDARVLPREDQRLQVVGTITDDIPLLTNDVVRYLSAKEFEWLGRADFTINTGGVKVHPEVVEGKLATQLTTPAIVSWIEDDSLGQKVVLVVEDTEVPTLDFSYLSKYEQPKAIYNLKSFPRSLSDKIDRNKVRELLVSRL